MKHTAMISFFLSIALLLSGCATPALEASTPAPLPALTAGPAPIPTPEPFNAAAAAERLERLFSAEFTADVGALYPQNLFDPVAPWRFFDVPSEERAWLLACAKALQTQLEEAAGAAAKALAGELSMPLLPPQTDIQGPSWQLCAALLQLCPTPASAQAALKRVVTLTATPKEEGGSLSLSLTLRPLPYKEALRAAAPSEKAFSSGQFLYAYTSTVYNEAMEEIAYEQPPAQGSLKAGIAWPLAAHTRLRKTWFADRSGGVRKHTGTDIWAPADTPIYSCTDGTITYIGSNEGQGNAVIVTDAYGYEFHYYHMIRLTDFRQVGEKVAAGDLIGHVGNTGNSDRDHLHVTILSPEGLFVNPYPYLAAVEP